MLQLCLASGFDIEHWYFKPEILLSKEGRPGQIPESIPSWQKETRHVADAKKHPVILNATEQLETRHWYQGQLADATTAIH